MDKYNVIKAVLSGAVAAISAKLGIPGAMPGLVPYRGVMIVDIYNRDVSQQEGK